MADTYLSMLKATIAALKADAATGAVVGDRIYTNVPQNETFPYVVIELDSGDYSSDTFSGMQHTIQANIYSRETSPLEVGNARKAIYDVLHRQENTLSLDTGNLSHIHFNGVAEVFKDTDGATWVGVIQFRAVVT